MRDFISSHMAIVYFLYGQAYFVLGLAVILKRRDLSRFRIARHIWLLGAFGIIHGVGEWGHLFIPIAAGHVDPDSISTMIKLQELLWAVSFAFLLQFGAGMLSPLLVNQDIRRAGKWLLPAWSAFVTATGIFFLPAGAGNNWIRYMLGIPAAAITAVAFISERRSFATFPLANARRTLLIAGTSFALFAVIAGLIGPQGDFWPASWLNDTEVFRLTGLPVEVYRAVIGLVLALVIVRTLSIFDAELSHRLITSEKNEALAQDRQRIARDLHDGTIQSIYAAGLQLEAISSLAGEEPQKVTPAIREVLKLLNNTISGIRGYIFQLGYGDSLPDIEEQIRRYMDEFSASSMVRFWLHVSGRFDDLSLKVQQNVLLIVHECISNIAKHSLAGEAEINLALRGGNLRLTVEDDGIGMNEDDISNALSAGGGLRNLTERAEKIGGKVEILGRPGKGMIMSMLIPVAPPTRSDAIPEEDPVAIS